MSSRERFEALADELGFFTKRAEDGVWYDDPDTDRLWTFFKAGEQQAIRLAIAEARDAAFEAIPMVQFAGWEKIRNALESLIDQKDGA